jgi:hypothetical protein
MLMLDSNCAGVRDRLQRLRDHDVPKALAKAVAPSPDLRQLAHDTALRTLEALAGAKEREFIPKFVATLEHGVFGNGFFMRLRDPFHRPLTLGEFQGARASLSPQDLNQSLFLQTVQDFDELMIRWVQEEKRKDERDWGKTDEEVGHFIAYLMTAPNPTPREMAARASLMPHIVDFLKRAQGEGNLAPETTATWLRAVLAAWREVFRKRLPERFCAELRALRNQLAI